MLSRNNFALIFSAFAAILIGQTFVAAQKPKSVSIYNAPKQLMLKGDDVPEDVDHTKFVLREKFYPIGWSKDGKFAFYTEPADEACGCYFAELIIQDLRTDKVLWRKDYSSENGGADTLRKYWAKNQKEFSRKLAQYGIKAEKTLTLSESPVQYQKDVLTPEIKVGLNLIMKTK